MKKDVYVVVGQYNHPSKACSFTELVAQLRELGEVNVIDMPRADSDDEVEKDGLVYVHHYVCPNKEIKQADMRIEEMIRDIAHLGAKACFIDYGVDAAYRALVKAIHTAMRTYGIKTYTLNKHIPFRLIRNMWMSIRFRIEEHKRYQHEAYEISQVEGFSGHGSMDGFRLSKIYEKQHQARKQVLELLR